VIGSFEKRRSVFQRNLETSVTIRASATDVWRVLSDTAGWSQWNPTIVSVQPRGGLRPGNPVALAIDFGPPFGLRRFSARLAAVEASRELSWTGGIPGLALAHHWFRIERAAEPGEVVFRHGESMRGAAVPMIWPLVSPRLRDRYVVMNDALRRHCEP
jgi:hypothetical protein